MSSDSSISSPNPNTNPQILEPDNFNPNKRISQIKEMNIPDWLSLPEEIWVIILSKVNTVDIIENVEIVCKLFRNICKQPSMYNVIDMTLPDECIDDDDNSEYFNDLTLFAVDRSSGNLADIYLEVFCDDETLLEIVERTRNLKHLRLGHHIDISDRDLVEAVKRLPMLEELELSFSYFYEQTIEVVGRACPSLKSFSINNAWPHNDKCNDDAMAISRSMHNLHRLQLIGNSMTNEGLKAILDGCPFLESLDIRACFHIDLSGDLGKRCEQVKHFRPPTASLEHFNHRDCKCNAKKFHTPSAVAGHLLCDRGNKRFGDDDPHWDDDLEYIDPNQEPEYYHEYDYNNDFDYGQANDVQPNDFPSQADLQEIMDIKNNDGGGDWDYGDYPDCCCDCFSGISSPDYTPDPNMDYDDWIDSLMP